MSAAPSPSSPNLIPVLSHPRVDTSRAIPQEPNLNNLPGELFCKIIALAQMVPTDLQKLHLVSRRFDLLMDFVWEDPENDTMENRLILAKVVFPYQMEAADAFEILRKQLALEEFKVLETFHTEKVKNALSEISKIMFKLVSDLWTIDAPILLCKIYSVKELHYTGKIYSHPTGKNILKKLSEFTPLVLLAMEKIQDNAEVNFAQDELRAAMREERLAAINPEFADREIEGRLPEANNEPGD